MTNVLVLLAASSGAGFASAIVVAKVLDCIATPVGAGLMSAAECPGSGSSISGPQVAPDTQPAAGAVAVPTGGPAPSRVAPAADRPSLPGLPVPALAKDTLLIVTRQQVLSVPTVGSRWQSLLSAAGDLGAVDLGDQNSTAAARTYGAALVYVRTGNTAYRDKVIAQLRQLPGAKTPPRNGDSGGVLSVARQLSGYIVAAGMVGYRAADFVDFVREIRTRQLGGHGRWDAISQTSEDTANNWGTWALATRIAASSYLADRADLAKAATIFKRFTGESTEFTGWRPTADFDTRWACTQPYVGINPASCGDRSGAVVEDISRSSGSYPEVDETGLSYSWEALGGAVISAKLLYLAGYPDVYEWGDRALLRAGEFIYQHAAGRPPRHSESQHIPWAINRLYGAKLSPLQDAGYGWAFGFTDWLY